MKRCIVLLFIFFVVSGCGRSFFYTALDSMTVSQVDDYLDLNPEQREQLKKQVKQDFYDVRKEVLPQVAKTLRDLDRKVALDTSAQIDFERTYKELQGLLKQATSRFDETAVELVAKLDESQLIYFQRRVLDNIEKLERSTDTAAKGKEQALQRYERYLEMVFGDLTSRQRDLLIRFLNNHPYPWSELQLNRRYVLNEFMKKRKIPEQRAEFLRAVFRDYEEVRLKVFRSALAHHEKAFARFLRDEFWTSMSRSQKADMKHRLIAQAERLERWSSQE